MPLLYSHLRFGKKCLEQLPQEYKNIVIKNIDYFYYGTQGPNILYFHSPFISRKYKDLSDSIHKTDILGTLTKTKQIFQSNKNRDAILSYSIGYITHFLLDSYCNEYLIKSSKILNINTNQLKKELERYYFKKDQIITPNKILNEFKQLDDINKVVSQITGIKENVIKQSVSNFLTYSKILYLNNKYILPVIIKLLQIIKHKDYADLLIYNKSKTNLAQIIRSDKYFEIALIHFKDLFINYINYLYDNSLLDNYYSKAFITDNKDIEVLNIEDEKKYIIKDFMK